MSEDFDLIRNKISLYTMNELIHQYRLSYQLTLPAYTNAYTASTGLPCKCRLKQLRYTGRHIRLADIDISWYLRPFDSFDVRIPRPLLVPTYIIGPGYRYTP